MSVVVVGAGAAGLVAAAFASSPEQPATLIERTSDGGRKILISGGGRCNVLPAALEPDRFVSSSPAHLVRRFLRAWPLEHQKEFFENELGIPLKFEDADLKYFPVSDRARDVRDALVAFAERRGVQFKFSTEVTNVTRRENAWEISTDRGSFEATRLIIATGGLSVPATGSDGRGLSIARAFGHTVHPTYPALTPLLCDPPRHESLAGVSLTARIRVKHDGKTREATGGFLFTHRGYSGPAVLDMSSFARVPGAQTRVAWSDVSAADWELGLTTGTGHASTVVGNVLPQRLADFLLYEAGVPPGRRIPELRRSERVKLIELLTAYPLAITGDEGFKKAEVTGGGVALDELDPTTLESRKVPGLYFCGEVLDAFGPIGGHNFAWAWSTGRACGVGGRG